MGKLLVVPHPAHLNSLAAARLGASARKKLDSAISLTTEDGIMTASGRRGRSRRSPDTPTLRDILLERDEALKLFAGLATTRTVKGIATMRGMAMAGETTLRVLNLRRHVVLPSLGALIMDDEMIDRRALEQTASIYENVLVPMIVPPRRMEYTEEGDYIVRRTRSATLGAAELWHQTSINVSQAHEAGLTGRGALVGVLDTGIDTSHPELAGRLLDTTAFAEFDKEGNRVVSSEPRDIFDHGTHVCGLIAGKTVGIAPGANLAVAAVLTYSTSRGPAGYLTQIASGLEWLLSYSFRGATADPGVDVINASLGGSGYDAYLYTPLAQARLALGTLLIAAIGNNGEYGVKHHGSPGNYDITIGVGAVNKRGTVAGFSDWGTVEQHPDIGKPDLCAPGVEVWSAAPKGGYVAMDGTSMASPIVAGTAALLIERNPQLGANVANLQREIFALTTTPPSGPRAGRGRLNLTDLR